MMDGNGYTLSDIAAVSGNGNSNGFGIGNEGIWIILLFVLLANGGWGYNGFGGGHGGVSENYTLISDMGQLERKIDGVYSGICDSTFALNNSIKDGFASATNVMTQGFAGLNTGMVQQGFETRNAITQDTIANMQGFNSVNSAIKDCCCQTQQNLKDVQYNMAMQTNGITNAVNTGFCQTNYNNQNNTRDLMENQNANTRAILDAIQANKVEALKDRIAEQDRRLYAYQLEESQLRQTHDITNRLAPYPIPAYVVQNPNCCPTNTCGCC